MSDLHPSFVAHEDIERHFVSIAEGQVHVRQSVAQKGDATPLLMIHASPASSINLIPLIRAFGKSRAVFAPDTLGNGDSAPPAMEVPEITDYADATLRVMDALGLDQVDLYGSHTGAHTSMEISIKAPDRVRRMILDGIAMFPDDEKADVLANYAPAIKPGIMGEQLNWAWHFVRDQNLYFPYFHRDAEHMRHADMSSPATLHAITVEVLKAIQTYHMAYRAAFRHPDRERLPLINTRTLVVADEADPLKEGTEEAAGMIAGATWTLCPSEPAETAFQTKVEILQGFLDD